MKKKVMKKKVMKKKVMKKKVMKKTIMKKKVMKKMKGGESPLFGMPTGVGTQFASSEKSNPLLHIQKENPSTINNRIAKWRLNTPQGFGSQFASVERDHQLLNNNNTVTPVYHKLNDRLENRRFGNTNMTGGSVIK